MPHISFRAGPPLPERTGFQLITAFVIAPIVLGVIFLSVVGWMTFRYHETFSLGDWLGVVWTLLVSPVLMIGLPATAWREWERRKQFTSHPPTSPPSAVPPDRP